MSIRNYIPNYLRQLAPVFTRGAWTLNDDASGSSDPVPAEVDAMEADKDLAEEAKTVREWAAKKVTTFPTRERNGEVKWGTRQVEDWSDGIVKPLPDPTITRGLGPPNHERFARSRIGAQVYFWDPTTTWSTLVGKPRCPTCGQHENVVGDGWPSTTSKAGLLPIFKLGGLDWIYGKSYRHRGCPAKGEGGGDTTFNTLNKEFLQTLPPGVLAKFPGVRTRHQVVDKNLMYLLERHMVNGTAAGFARMVQEVELENVLDHQLLYANHVDMYNSSLPKNTLATCTTPKAFDGNTLHGAARYASGAYYMQCYKDIAKQDADFKRRHIMSQGGEVLRMDFTFKEAKHVRIDGKKQLGGVLTIENEYCQPVRQFANDRKSIADFESELKLHAASYDDLKLPPPRLVYVDDPEQSERTILNAYPSVRPENGGYGVKLDPTHGMRRILQTLTMDHPFTGAFMQGLSMVLYELDMQDVQNVKDVLKKGTPRRAAMSQEAIDELPLFAYWHHHPSVKRRLRTAVGPDGMIAKFDEFWSKWLRCDCGEKPLFTEGPNGTEVAMARLRSLMQNGYISDPPASQFAMHIEIRRTADGLPVYICKRGNSQLEGYHSHLHKTMRDAPNHGPELADLLMLDFNFGYSVRAAIKNRGVTDFGSRSFHKLHSLNDIYNKYNAPPPYANVPPLPEVEGSMGILRFDKDHNTFQALRIWVESELPVGDSEDAVTSLFSHEVVSSGMAEGSTDAEKYLQLAATLCCAKVKDAEEPPPRSSTPSPTKSPPTKLPSSPGRPTAAEVTREGARAQNAVNMMSVANKKRKRQSELSAMARGLPDIERPFETREEKEEYMRFRDDYVKDDMRGGAKIPEDAFVRMAHTWNTTKVFPTMVLGESGQPIIPGPIYLKTARHMKDHEDTVRTVAALHQAKETMPGGAQGYSDFMRNLSRATFGFASSLPVVAHPASTSSIHASMMQHYSASLNPVRLPTSQVLVEDAARAAAARAAAAQALGDKRHNNEGMMGKKKYCNTCFLHKSGATGHGRRNADCPYGERMAECKGGDLLPGKKLLER